jgi:ketosteroid isomerase-like protein
MQRTVGFAVLVLVSLSIGFSPTESLAQKPGKAEQQVIQLERDWCTAVVKKDAALLGRILADDYTSVNSRGLTSTKAEELADLKIGQMSITACVDENLKVRIYGDAAVVTGQGTRSGTFKGVAFKDRKILYMDVFIKKDGRWQCVASQATVIAAQQK